ncbi:DeoR/GlpR family DNA-binding transcription regulator [Hansschlegelia sp. KR7-227]|uniref:DeoR/GlpR family DNA-binding transcription regulator n=1 Tax=Hansschlegelia sp. KR7-227 TaxID=3400914 RepID=UPI003C0AC7DA
MNQSPRQRAIVELVRDEDVTRVAELAGRLGVSDETIRRNVKGLVENGLLTRRHGEVAFAGPAVDAPFLERMRVHAAAKKALAAAAVDCVEDGQVLMIDTGSTTAYVAQALRARRGLTVVTNSLEIAGRLVGRNDNRVYMAGGELRADLAAAVGAEAAAFIRQFRADLAILSIAGIDARGSFTDFDLDEAGIARAMIECSDQRLVVADGSKFGRRAPVAICDPGEVHCLVTDVAPPPGISGWIEDAGITLVLPQAGANGRRAPAPVSGA